ncbi:hypothetical protein HYU19_05640 [Candidatus Woesearchaeota archaeon]|nr:hypothetical protein [Candidatus Woesearchaeota archaeon]
MTSATTSAKLQKIQRIGIPLFMMLLVPLSVSAQQFAFLGKFRQVMNTVFLGNYFQANFVFWMKFLLFWLLFTVFYFAAQRVLGHERRNAALILALIVSFIGIIPMRQAWLYLVFELWHGLIGLLLVVAPIVAILYLSHTTFNEDNRMNHGIKAFLYFVMAMALYHISATSGATPLSGLLWFQPTLEFAMLACIFVMFWQLFHTIVGPGGAGGGAGAGGGRGGGAGGGQGGGGAGGGAGGGGAGGGAGGGGQGGGGGGGGQQQPQPGPTPQQVQQAHAHFVQAAQQFQQELAGFATANQQFQHDTQAAANAGHPFAGPLQQRFNQMNLLRQHLNQWVQGIFNHQTFQILPQADRQHFAQLVAQWAQEQTDYVDYVNNNQQFFGAAIP